jgi:ATP-binding cassette subfamily B protein
LLPVASVYLSRAVVDSVVAAIRGQGVQPAIVAAALMAGVLLASELLRSAASYVRTAQSGLVHNNISALIHEKSVAADLAFYDSPEFYDHLHRAKDEASYRPGALMDSIGTLGQSAITLVAMAAVLIPYGAWLPAALAVGTLPALYVALRFSLLQHAMRRRMTQDERRAWYYEWLLTTGEPAAEIRLFDLGAYFRTAFQALQRKLLHQRLGLAARQALAEMLAGAAGLVVTAGAMLWMMGRAMRGQATLGDLVLFYQAFQQGLRLMRSLLENIGQLYGNMLFLGNLFEFLELSPKVADPAEPASLPAGPRDGIRFRKVSFRYPGNERLALEEFDLFLPAGRITAVVGPNGAGKSTLVKLLARFYDPESGSLEMDGANLRGFALKDLRDRITILFQQPVHFNATARENVAFGDMAGGGDVNAAVRDAGAEPVIAKLPEGLDTPLGRWFAEDGKELSVGEWQRVALARAFLRKTPILILDEPTSAMDPWAEAEWLSRFRELAGGRTALVITHRFTTAMFADGIHVMDGGRIVESGSHEELLNRGGQYAEAWSKQGRG